MIAEHITFEYAGSLTQISSPDEWHTQSTQKLTCLLGCARAALIGDAVNLINRGRFEDAHT